MASVKLSGLGPDQRTPFDGPLVWSLHELPWDPHEMLTPPALLPEIRQAVTGANWRNKVKFVELKAPAMADGWQYVVEFIALKCLVQTTGHTALWRVSDPRRSDPAVSEALVLSARGGLLNGRTAPDVAAALEAQDPEGRFFCHIALDGALFFKNTHGFGADDFVRQVAEAARRVTLPDEIFIQMGGMGRRHRESRAGSIGFRRETPDARGGGEAL